MRWAGHEARMVKRGNEYRGFEKKPEETTYRPRLRWVMIFRCS